jgi:hypothetical protein
LQRALIQQEIRRRQPAEEEGRRLGHAQAVGARQDQAIGPDRHLFRMRAHPHPVGDAKHGVTHANRVTPAPSATTRPAYSRPRTGPARAAQAKDQPDHRPHAARCPRPPDARIA